MNQKKVLALLLSLCLIVSMTVPVFAAGTRGSSWTSGSAAMEASGSTSGSMTLVEDETTVTEGTELRASTYVLTNDGSSASAPVETYTAVPSSSKISDLAQSGETYYYLSDGVYHVVTFTQSSFGIFQKWTTYTLTANGKRIAYAYATSTLSSTRLTLYTKSVSEVSADSTMALTADAAAYSWNNGGATAYANGTTLKYFPVTLYNYDTDKINNATHQVEVDADANLTQWNGIYFNTGCPGSESFSYTTSATPHDDLSWTDVQSGRFYSDEACTTQVTVSEITETQTTQGYSKVSVTNGQLISENSNNWEKTNYYYKSGSNYYPLYAKRESYYSRYNYTWGYLPNEGNEVSEVTTDYYRKSSASPSIDVYSLGDTTTTVTTGYKLTAGGSVLATLDGTDTAAMIGVTLYTKGSTSTTSQLRYANWDYWTGFLTTENTVYTDKQTAQKGYVYSGLVQNRLENGQIKFNVPDGGIFDSADTSTKEVYTNVGLPFVYNDTTKYYTFDASQDGAYFSGTPASEKNLTWSDTPQYKQAGSGAAGNGFYPFNSSTNFAESAAQYHFGMIATVPFTMTTDGLLSSTNKEEIVFNFAGDDDVWVFIDGVLVLDIGGIHDSVDGSINFAQNTTTVSATTSGQTSGKFTYGSSGSTEGVITGKLFNDNEGTGILGQNRETFAAKDEHTLTVYYLERGKGASNCKIQFNLPMKDTVSVHKVVSSTDSAGAELDSDTIVSINNRPFGFTLYKNNEIVANATYNLYDVNNQYLSTASTDSTGHFTLKNGETAKFTGEISATNGDTYYVVEDDLGASWQAPVFSYTANAANGSSFTVSETNGQSMSVTATGSTEAADSIAFTCTNTMLHVNGTSLEANDDKIVIDYGLPVEIDVLSNDIVTKGTKSIVDGSITGAKYGTVAIENGKIKYQLTSQLTGVEVLTYTVKATASSGVENDNVTENAKIYIIPATSMYYEEDFNGLVTFPKGAWDAVGTAQTDPQEPGVVGTVGDSPYGSDAAYLNDSGDSNGSSMHVDTTAGSASFSYTFTGTGTSFFARTSGSTATIVVKVTDQNGNQVAYNNRNTIYTSVTGTDVGTLYNIPVYTIDSLGYGTYTVDVTVLKAVQALNYGAEFYLDGIRVINPLDSNGDNASIATSAYATDGEANMTMATLRQKLIDEAQINEDDTISWNEGDNFVLFTDTNGGITSAEEYKSNGPKEEVYLNNGQSVTFSLSGWDPNTNKIYLGIKAPVGSGTVSVNGNTVNIINATDCYYDISGYANITTAADGIKTATFEIKATSSLISVTNIKVTGNAIFTIVNQDDVNVDGNDYE